MNDKPSPMRETDEPARRLARTLLRSAGYAAIAVLDPSTGFPSASRVLVGTDIDGVPVILVSGLSAHTKALANDRRASLLVGEPGKGDPLAYARLGVQCLAVPVSRDQVDHARLRERFLARHPKSRLYIDFQDFMFFRLEPQTASLNGGFGRAYMMPGEDLQIRSPMTEFIAVNERLIVQDLLGTYPSLGNLLARNAAPAQKRIWTVYGMDAAGFDLKSAERLLRCEFDAPLKSQGEITLKITKIVNAVP